jgi:hypothetical protein
MSIWTGCKVLEPQSFSAPVPLGSITVVNLWNIPMTVRFYDAHNRYDPSAERNLVPLAWSVWNINVAQISYVMAYNTGIGDIVTRSHKSPYYMFPREGGFFVMNHGRNLISWLQSDGTNTQWIVNATIAPIRIMICSARCTPATRHVQPLQTVKETSFCIPTRVSCAVQSTGQPVLPDPSLISYQRGGLIVYQQPNGQFRVSGSVPI